MGVCVCVETLDLSERQVDQETVAIVQPAEDECRNKGIEDGRRYAATDASQLTKGGKTAGRCLLHVGLHRQFIYRVAQKVGPQTHDHSSLTDLENFSLENSSVNL